MAFKVQPQFKRHPMHFSPSLSVSRFNIINSSSSSRGSGCSGSSSCDLTPFASFRVTFTRTFRVSAYSEPLFSWQLFKCGADSQQPGVWLSRAGERGCERRRSLIWPLDLRRPGSVSPAAVGRFSWPLCAGSVWPASYFLFVNGEALHLPDT